jgi:fibronectin type 3 domain-containing protein
MVFNSSVAVAGSLKASWNTNAEPDLAGYKIYYGESSGNYTNSINVGKATQYTVNQLRDDVTYYFVVTAYDTAGNESGYSLEVSAKTVLIDSTPPAVSSVTPRNLSTVEIKFSEAVAAASALDKTNYVIDNGVTIATAAFQANSANIVLLSTSAHAAGTTYKITIQRIADRAAPPNVMPQAVSFDYNFQATDQTPPSVSNVRIVNPSAVEVLFSEPVALNSAQNIGNYALNPGMTISAAQLQNDARTVRLTTNPHANGATYTLTVRNIADRATPANVMPQARSFNYTYQAEDRQAPEVNAVTLTDPNHILIVFSEQVTPASAQNSANYRISDGIQVQQAQLAANGLEATLTTSAHQYNRDYNLTILNIKDRSAAANTIAANTTFTYFLTNYEGSGLHVNALNPARYVADSLRVGEAYYIDRPYVIRQIPNSKRNLLWIKTANVDRTNSSARFLEFTLTRESNIYVAYDSRAVQPPDWLKNYFTDTGEVITVSESAEKLNLWKSRYVPGRVSLGGNVAAGVETSTSLSMYVVMIEDVLAPPEGGSSTPQNFVLKQNYPNPFSRSGGVTGLMQTQIEYYLQEQHTVTLTIHNAIGQVVRQLYNGLKPGGTHRATWDGRGDNGALLPSGTYLCILEVRDEVNDAGFAMTASLNRQTRVMTLLK